MNPEYYESLVLVAIKRLLDAGFNPSHLDISEGAGIGNRTVARAILRLEKKGRLSVARGKKGWQLHKYAILDQPTEADLLATELHKKFKL